MYRVEDINMELETARIETAKIGFLANNYYEETQPIQETQQPNSEDIDPRVQNLIPKFQITKNKEKSKWLMPKRPKDIKSEFVEVFNKGYIPMPSSTAWVLFSEPGTGKTMITIKNGIVYLLDNPTKQIFLWLAEDSKSQIEERFQKICESMGIYDWEQLYNERTFLITREDGVEQWAKKENGVIVPNAEYIATLAQFCIDNNVGFCAFDTLAKFFYNLKENDNDEMGIAMELYSVFASVTGSSVSLLHHTNKDGGFRGATVIVGTPRYAIWIARAKILDKETGKKIDDPKYDGRKIKIGREKDNLNIWRHCQIYDDNGMIDVPLAISGSFGAVEETVYNENAPLPEPDSVSVPFIDE